MNNTDQNAAQNKTGPQHGNKPVETLWDGPIKMAIFENRKENGNVTYASVPGRIYTDAQGRIRESTSFSPGELLRLSKLSDKAYERIGEFKQHMKSQNKGRQRER
ncbi:MAG: hypothetical protein AB2765_07850 [Candidatus Thiodiazotropha endolucinida]